MIEQVKNHWVLLALTAGIWVLALTAGEATWNSDGIPYWLKLLSILGSLFLVCALISKGAWRWSMTTALFLGTVLVLFQMLVELGPNLTCWSGWLLPGIEDTCR